jgi:biotin synthase-related radical SAM superfamily protein
MDPNKELTYKNTIPQCNMCNRPSRNYFVFDKRGRVDKIADPKFIMRSDKPIQIKSMENLIKKYPTQAENLIKKIEE